MFSWNEPPKKPEPMTKAKNVKYLIDFYVWYYEKSRKSVRRKSESIKIATIVLGGTTTILIGLKEFSIFSAEAEWLGVGALVVSATVTMLSTWQAFASYNWRWIHYREMLMNFRRMETDFDYLSLSDDPPKDQDCDTYMDRINKAIDDANERWRESRTDAIGG